MSFAPGHRVGWTVGNISSGSTAGVGALVPRTVGPGEGRKVGEAVGAPAIEGAPVVGGIVGTAVAFSIVGADVGDSVSVKFAMVGLIVGSPKGVGAAVGSDVSSTTFAKQESDAAKIWHCPSHSPPKKQSDLAASWNTRLPGAGQNVESTSVSTKFSVPENEESLSANTTNDVDASLMQLC